MPTATAAGAPRASRTSGTGSVTDVRPNLETISPLALAALALGSEVRCAIIMQLSNVTKPQTTASLALKLSQAGLDSNVSNISYHLTILERAGIVEVDRSLNVVFLMRLAPGAAAKHALGYLRALDVKKW